MLVVNVPVQLYESYSDSSSINTAGPFLTLLLKSRQETPNATRQCQTCRQHKKKDTGQNTTVHVCILFHSILFYSIKSQNAKLLKVDRSERLVVVITHQVAHKAQIG